jgi:hypothetical protein
VNVVENSLTKTDTKKKAVIQAMEKSMGIVTHACKMAEISRETFYKWMREDDQFQELVTQATEQAKDFVESKLYEQISKGNVPSIIFYMKTKCKDRGYIERTEHQIQQFIEQPIFPDVSEDDSDK